MRQRRWVLGIAWAAAAWAQAPPPAELAGYRTVATAQTTTVKPAPAEGAGLAAYLGVAMAAAGDGAATVDEIEDDSPAARAGLLKGDRLVAVAGQAVPDLDAAREAVHGAQPGAPLPLKVKRGDKVVDLTATPTATSRPLPQPPENPDRNPFAGRRPGAPVSTAAKESLRLAVIGVEFPDVKHSAKLGPDAWNEFFFSTGTYQGKPGPSGTTVAGSLNDYYREVSCGAFHVEGKLFDWVSVAKNRPEYTTASGQARAAFFGEVLDALRKRDGETALDGFDALIFLYAGERVPTNRGGLYWPHRSGFQWKSKYYNYLICPEGGDKGATVSVFCHEFGHILRLPDLYAMPEVPGMEGLGQWCLMSENLPGVRPQHMSAWCKERLGWLKPAVLDPRVKQKLILGPIEGSANECYKVLIRPDASEYLLLENRRKTGFDQGLPGEGLLIWHVTGQRPTLEESHGIEGPAGPRVQVAAVPYPSPANSAFTPYTLPASRSFVGGGWPVWITDIKRLADGRVAFKIGYEVD